MNLLKYYFIVLPLLFCLSISGQEVVWADQLVEFSSQLYNSAGQVLGVPDAIEQQDQDLAWTPKKEGLARGEFIHVSFPFPIRTRQIIISEVSNPGAIFRLTAFFTDGTETLIYENKYPRNLLVPNRVFTYQFPLTRKKVVSVKLELDTRSVKGYNRIDAIGISDETERYTSEPFELQEKEGNLGTEVNSTVAEVSPQISADGKTLYFVRHNHSDNMGEGDIWVSKRLGEDRWSTAVNLGAPINNRRENQVIGVGENGTKLFLKMGREKTDNNNIFVTQKTGRSWGRPKRLNINLPTDLQIHHIFISGNGKIILVAIETVDAGFDLQVTNQGRDGKWTKLTSLGTTINTSDDETSTCLSADGKILYFSSNGHGGMGRQDFFVSRRKGDSWNDWSEPVNLGNEINDATDNEKLSLAANNIYAVFSRKNKAGNNDIYQIDLPENLIATNGEIGRSGVIDLDKKNNEPRLTDRQIGQETITNKSKNDYTALSEGTMITKKGTENSLELRLQKIDQQITNFEKTKEQLRRQKIQHREMPDNLSEGEEMEELRGQFIENKKDSKLIFRDEVEEDVELAKMKNKFNQINGKTTSTSTKGKNTTKDRELEEMKKRFNKHNGKAESTNDDEEYMDMEVSNGQVYDEEYDRMMYSGGFTDLQQKMWSTLEAELADLVKLTIKKQVYTQVENELLQSLSENLDEAQQYRFRQQGILLYREIKKELRKVSGEKITLGNIPENDITIALRRKMEPLVRKNLYADLRDLAADEINNELQYRFAKEEKAVLGKELKNRPAEWSPTVVDAPVPVSDQRQEPVLLSTFLLLKKGQLKIPFREGQKFLIENISFRKNSGVLKSQSSSEIDQIVDFLNAHENLSVEIGIFDDGAGEELAFIRAKTIYESLTRQGITANRLLYRDYAAEGQTNKSSFVKAQLKIVSIR